MQDDIFLLNNERSLFAERDEVAVAAVAVADVIEERAVVEEQPVVSETVQEPVVTYNKPGIKYKGANTNGLVILVHYSTAEFMHDAHLTALENTLKRMGHELNAAAILNMAHHTDANFEQILNDLKPKKLVLMGKNALPHGISPINLNQLQPIGSCTTLYTFSFDEMMDSNELKKAFWEQMKGL